MESRTSRLLECARIARRQYGVLCRSQSREAGLSRFAVHRLIESGTWDLIHPGVYRLWTPEAGDQCWKQRMMAAALWLGTASGGSHRAAAVLWELDGIASAPIEMTTTGRQRSPEHDIVIHHVKSLPRADRAMRNSIPVTSIGRTLVDLASVVEAETLELALESALRRGLTTKDRIRRQIARSGPTSRGRGVLRELVAIRATATESALETLVWRTLIDAGLPPSIRQYTVVGPEGDFAARVDFAYVQARLAIEADGYGFHSKPDDWRRDRRRQNALTRMGWTVYRVTWEDITRRPRAVVEAIAHLLAARTATGTAPSHEA